MHRRCCDHRAGDNASKVLRGEITQSASAAPWASATAAYRQPTGACPGVTGQDWLRQFPFCRKIPSGVTFQVWAEPGSGGFSNRVDWGTVIGDGSWQLVRREFVNLAGSENFRTALNMANTRNFKLVFQGSASVGAGAWIQLDDFQVMPWQKYEVRLGDGTNGQPAFLNYLNANHSVSFIPTFNKLSDAPPGGQTLITTTRSARLGPCGQPHEFIATATRGAHRIISAPGRTQRRWFDRGLLTNI